MSSQLDFRIIQNSACVCVFTVCDCISGPGSASTSVRITHIQENTQSNLLVRELQGDYILYIFIFSLFLQIVCFTLKKFFNLLLFKKICFN